MPQLLYDSLMAKGRFRRVCALVLVVALGLGAALHGVQAADMSMMMSSMAMSDDGKPDSCSRCDGDGGMGAAGCSQVCLGFVAVMPAELSAGMAVRPVVPIALATSSVNRTGQPEPYPPRTIGTA